MVIKINTKTEIMWIIVVLYLLKTYVFDAEVFFVLCVCVIGLYTIRRKNIVIPKIPGLIFYVLVLILATVIGMTKYPISFVERDVFYEFFSVLYLVIGYYSFDYYKGKKKSLWKTVCFSLFIISGICIGQGITSVTAGADFATFREQFSQSVGSISFIVPILVGKKYIYKENTFSEVRDNGLIVLWILQLLLNLSRISIINMVIGMVVFIICGVYKKRLNIKNSFRILFTVVIIGVLGMAFINTMPNEAKDRFEEKFTNSLTEISAGNEYEDISDAQSDWRGYEIHCAQEQWRKSDLLSQVIGNGNGTLVYIHFVPDQWKQTVEHQNGKVGVTVLHNTYYTLLVKGGLLSVIALLALFGLNILKAKKSLVGSHDESISYATIMIILSVLILIDAYVIRNMMDKGSEMSALLLIGWINAQINNVERNHRYINEKI